MRLVSEFYRYDQRDVLFRINYTIVFKTLKKNQTKKHVNSKLTLGKIPCF